MKNIHVIPTDKPSRLFDDGIDLYLGELKDRKGHPVTSYNIYITSDEEPKAGDWSLYQNKIHKCIEDIVGDEFKKIILTTDQYLIKDGAQKINDEFLEWFVKNPSCEEVEIQNGWRRFDEKLGYLKRYKIIIPKEEPKPFKDMLPLTKVEWEKFKKNPIPGKEEEPKQVWGKPFVNTMPMIKSEPKQEYEYIGECKGNNDDGCFMNSSGHNCGCYTRKLIKQETLEEFIERASDECNIIHFSKYEFEKFIKLGAKWQQERMYSEEEVRDMFNRYNEFISHHDPEEWQSWINKQFKKK